VLSRLHEKPDDTSLVSLKEITKLARFQRNPYVVQRDIQFEFCYIALCEVLNRLLRDHVTEDDVFPLGHTPIRPLSAQSCQSEEEFA
jgi:hypothetical protein